MRRRSFVTGFLGAGLLPAMAQAAPLVDVLQRPAAAAPPSTKPAMVRIVRAGTRLVAVGERGIVLLSDDNGQQWRQAKVPVSTSLTGVQFIDAQHGWAIGHAGMILNTTDGGQTWARQHDGRSSPPDGVANPLLDLHFIDAQQGWVVGAYGTALRTTDGGRSWQSIGNKLPNPKGLHMYAIARHGSGLFIAGEQGLFVSVTDHTRPESAMALATPYRGSFFALLAMPQGALMFGGLRGTLLLRTEAGEFRPLNSSTTLGIVSATALPGDRQALVDQSGRVLLGSAAENRFIAQPAEPERRWAAVVLAGDGALVGACNIGVGRLPTQAS